MNCDRLERLATLLEGYSDNAPLRFDLESWGATNRPGGGVFWRRDDSCNTAACAVGHACSSGIFVKDGLSHASEANGTFSPTFGEFEGWMAVKAFFDLDQSQATKLFAAHSYERTEGEAAARAVAARIRQTVAAHGQAI